MPTKIIKQIPLNRKKNEVGLFPKRKIVKKGQIVGVKC